LVTFVSILQQEYDLQETSQYSLPIYAEKRICWTFLESLL